jgi:hypothetical protein
MKLFDRNAVLRRSAASFLILRRFHHRQIPKSERGSDVVEETYLVRYGVMAHVGRFSGPLDDAAPFQRGQLVVIETERGVELGEVLTALETTGAPPGRHGNDDRRLEAEDPSACSPRRLSAEILRSATADEVARVAIGARERTARFELCQRSLQQFDWPWELIDVEPLLDDRTLILHYLGPHELDSAAVRAWFRTAHSLDVIFEPVGTDEPGQTASAAAGSAGGQGCGASGCGHGGCGSGVDAANPRAGSSAHGCVTSPHSGCSSCGIMRMITERGQRF